MALNGRQMNFITKLKAWCEKIEALYGEAHALGQSFDEEFDDASVNSLLDSNTDLNNTYAVQSTDVKVAINKTVDNFINFWTGSAVNTDEYGKYIRRIK